MPSSPTARPTSPSPPTCTASSPSCTPGPRTPPSTNAAGCSNCSSRTSSSDPRRSPSGTASRCANASPATLNPPATPTRRVNIPNVAQCVGGVVSPVLANLYLHRLDRAWRGAYGTLARYADDALVMCRSQGQAVAALARLTALLAELGLQPKPAKTRIVQLAVDGGGVDFLGFHHRLVQSRARRGPNRLTYLARWPSRKAMQHARDRIRFMTMRARRAR